MGLLREKISNRGGVAQIVKRYGLLRTIDIFLIFLHSLLAKRLYRAREFDFGFSEAIWHPRTIDGWCRYADIAREITKINAASITILDVGSSGHGGLGLFKKHGWRRVSLDIQRDAFTESPDKSYSVVGDGCNLPFRDKSVDIALSVASAEHIPQPMRNKLFKELKRATKQKIILHLPVTSKDGNYRARTYDIKFQNAFRRLLGYDEPNTAEHLASTHPTVEEIQKEFQGAQYLGRKNCDVWYKYMLFSSVYIIGFLTGLIYYLFWRKSDRPPYYECMIVYTPENTTHL